MSAELIIVGAGQAGGQAVHTLIQNGFSGRITLIGEEPYPPYQRPPLSKKYLAGELERKRLYLRPPDFYSEHGVELALGVGAVRLEAPSKRVELADGRVLGCDALLLATGSRVRRVDVPGARLEGVHYLRTITDADGIIGDLTQGQRIVVVGAGYIGLEVAAVARSLGHEVTVLEAAERVMARVVCDEVSEFYRGVHEAAGVCIECGSGLRELVGETRVEAAVTADGKEFPCDCVVVGVGIVPETRLAEQAGLHCDDGICVDDRAQTSEPGIYAAGDCTNHPNALLGRRIRLESVHNAVEQAKTAAQSMLGHAPPYAQVPWFWSDQYDLKLQIAGVSQDYERVVLRGDPAQRRFAAYYLRRGRLIAVDAVNSPRDFLLAKKLIAARTALDAATIESAGDDLGEIARAMA